MTTAERCRCGHNRPWHDDRAGCQVMRCLNVCVEYVPVKLPDPGERPVFGVHHIPADEAWTPEPLSDYWNQNERWKP